MWLKTDSKYYFTIKNTCTQKYCNVKVMYIPPNLGIYIFTCVRLVNKNIFT